MNKSSPYILIFCILLFLMFKITVKTTLKCDFIDNRCTVNNVNILKHAKVVKEFHPSNIIGFGIGSYTKTVSNAVKKSNIDPTLSDNEVERFTVYYKARIGRNEVIFDDFVDKESAQKTIDELIPLFTKSAGTIEYEKKKRF